MKYFTQNNRRSNAFFLIRGVAYPCGRGLSTSSLRGFTSPADRRVDQAGFTSPEFSSFFVFLLFWGPLCFPPFPGEAYIYIYIYLFLLLGPEFQPSSVDASEVEEPRSLACCPIRSEAIRSGGL